MGEFVCIFLFLFLFLLAILYSRSVICLLNNLNRIFFLISDCCRNLFIESVYVCTICSATHVSSRYYLPYLPACCVFCSSSVSVIENNTQYFMIMLITLFEKTSVSAGFTRPLFIKWFDEVRTRSEQAIATILSEL